MPTPDPSGTSPRGAPATAALVVAPWWRWYAPAIAAVAFWLLVAGPARLLWPQRLSSVEAITLALAAAASWGILSLRRLQRLAEAALASAGRERRRAEEELTRSEASYRAVFENMAEGMLVADAATKEFRRANPAICRMLGYSEGELLGMSVLDIHPKTSLPRVVAEFEKLTKGETGVARDLPCLRKDGVVIRVDISVSPNIRIDDRKCTVGFFEDVTEQRQAEAALRESEERYRAITESAHDSIFCKDTDCRYTFANKAMQTLLGLPAAEIVGKTPGEIFDEEAAAVIAEVDRAAMSGETVDAVRTLNIGGEEVAFHVIQQPLRSSDGEIVGITGIVRDITERKQAEEALRQSEERYRATIDAMGDMIHVVDRDLRFILVNATFRHWCRALGLGADPIGQTVVEFFPFLPDRVRDEYEQVFETSETLVTEEAVKVGDSEFITETRKIPMVERGCATRMVTVVRDVTQRRRAEQALRESEERYRQLVELSPDPVVVLQDGVYKFVSPAFTEVFGYEQEDIDAGLSFFQLVHEQDVAAVRQRYEDRLAGKDLPRTYEIDLVAKDGHTVPSETSAALIQHDGRPADLVTIRDITERKQLAERLRQAHKMEAVGTLAAGIAHDFNNMMTPIMGYARFLVQGLPEGERLHRFAETILRTATRAAALPRRLLAFSRQQSLKVEVLDVNAVINDMNKMLVRMIGEDIEVQTRLAPDLHRVRGDETQLEQILLNLAINAREAMPEGGRFSIATQNVAEDEARRDAGADAPTGDSVCITVSDTGVGMAPQTLASIYEPYYTTKGMATNTGLGLSVVYGIVKQHGGAIAAQSDPGRGSTFRVYFPAAPATEAPVGPTAVEEPETAGHGECILFVEDETVVRRFLGASLRDQGYTVLECATATMAVETFEREAERIELVFSDVMLPDSDALQLVDELTKRKPTLKVLLTSGYTDGRSRTEAIRERGYRFLPKPVLLPELLQAIREVLDAG